jgi:hypothetical protein
MGERADYAYGKSSYLKGDELAGKSVRVVISNVEDVEFEKGLKPVLSFEGKNKKLVINVTNFDILCAGIGNKTTDWIGHTITLRGEKVSFKGKLVDSIRVSVDAPPKQQQQTPPWDGELNDEVPNFGGAAA